MNPIIDESAPSPVEPMFPGLAPVFEALGRKGGPAMGVNSRQAILLGAMLMSGIAGSAVRIDLPLRTRTRTNPHAIFAGVNQGSATKLLKALLSPLEAYISELLDCVPVRATSRRMLKRELQRDREVLSQLEAHLNLLEKEFEKNQSMDIDSKLQELASRLGIPHANPDTVRRRIGTYRLALGQMLVVSGLELDDVRAWSSASLDGHVMELIVDSRELERLLALHPKHLAHVARFRFDSCLDHGIVAHQGRIGNHPRISTLWFAEQCQVDEMLGCSRLRQVQLGTPFIVVNLDKHDEGHDQLQADPSDFTAFFHVWRGFLLKMFQLRFLEKQVRLVPTDDAWNLLESSTTGATGWFHEKVALPALAMVSAINACAKYPDIESISSATITLPDVEAAVALLRPELEGTLHRRAHIVPQPARTPAVRNLDELLAKLAAKGPLTRRELQRSFNRITSEELGNLLSAALHDGRLVERRDGSYALPPLSRPPSPPVSVNMAAPEKP